MNIYRGQDAKGEQIGRIENCDDPEVARIWLAHTEGPGMYFVGYRDSKQDMPRRRKIGIKEFEMDELVSRRIPSKLKGLKARQLGAITPAAASQEMRNLASGAQQPVVYAHAQPMPDNNDVLKLMFGFFKDLVANQMNQPEAEAQIVEESNPIADITSMMSQLNGVLSAQGLPPLNMGAPAPQPAPQPGPQPAQGYAEMPEPSWMQEARDLKAWADAEKEEIIAKMTTPPKAAQ